MKIPFKRFIPVTTTSFLLIAGAPAQTFTVLHAFGTSGDGTGPDTPLLLADGTLYGATAGGGGLNGGVGTVFKINTDGSGYALVHSFTGGSDGDEPWGLALSGGTLYGTTTAGGGSVGAGTVFQVNTDGTGFSILHNFNISDGDSPEAGLVLSAGTLYGTAETGGTEGQGTIFKLAPDGTSFTTLHNFSALESNLNDDGALPEYTTLILSEGTLYGTASVGGSGGTGTVFKINTDGTGFTVLHDFTSLGSDYPYTNTDGAEPQGGLALAAGTLYGTAHTGGAASYGTIFKLNTDGTDFTVLHAFLNTTNDGAGPASPPIVSGSTLFGTAEFNSPGHGMVYQINTDGTGFTDLYDFSGGTDGGFPTGALTLSGGTLYGTAQAFGTFEGGVVFSLTPRLPVIPPSLQVVQNGDSLVLSWPSSAVNYNLETSATLGAGASWTVLTSGIVVSGNNFTLTYPVTGEAAFFRLQLK